VGHNGVGKSSLMKLAVGLLRPSQGEVRVLGAVAGSVAARATTGFCPDFERLPEAATGAVFVAWMLRYHGYSRQQARERSAAVLAELGLGDAMRRPIREYSKGMRQRVRLAQALAHEPRIVLLDEPMAGLDPVARAELSATIRSLPGRGVGVLVSSHVLHELEAVVDRVVMVHQGRLLAEGRVQELRAKVPSRPHRLRIVAPSPRQLAAAMLPWPEVAAVVVVADGLEVAVSGDREFYRRLTELAARWPGGLQELAPLDDDLSAVFGYMVG
jgi:ABC-2 type transport system ATP-binding protein